MGSLTGAILSIENQSINRLNILSHLYVDSHNHVYINSWSCK